MKVQKNLSSLAISAFLSVICFSNVAKADGMPMDSSTTGVRAGMVETNSTGYTTTGSNGEIKTNFSDTTKAVGIEGWTNTANVQKLQLTADQTVPNKTVVGVEVQVLGNQTPPTTTTTPVVGTTNTPAK